MIFSPPLLVLGGNKIKETRVYKILEKNISEPSTCSCEEAITVKIACNAFHALKVVFANEIRNVHWSNIIDVEKVMEIFIKDIKLNISSSYLKPGLPFGGPCLPKDTQALANALFDSKKEFNLFDSIIKRNDLIKELYCKSIIELGFEKVGFYGLEFKPDTGDLRNSPVVDIAKLVSKIRNVYVYDKNLKKDEVFSEFNICDSLDKLKSESDIIITYHEDSKLQKFINWKEIKI